MSVYTKEQLQDLNRYMLGLGAPIERDNVGYSRPDYALMEGVGRYNHEISDQMAYAIVERLGHYMKTQLTEEKADLTETYFYYREKLQQDKAMKFTDIYADYQKGDFISNEVHYVGETPDKTIISFDGSLYLADIDIPYRRELSWGRDAAGNTEYKELYVPNDKMVDFLSRVSNYGKYGYAPDAKLQEKVEELKKIYGDRPIDSITVVGQPPEQNGYYLKFNTFVNIADFKKEEEKVLPNCMRWATLKGQSVLFVHNEELPYLYRELKENSGLYNHQLDEFCKNFPYVTAEERVEQAKQMADKMAAEEAQRMSNKNRSGNHLCDYKKFDLPFEPYPFQVEDATHIVESKHMLIGHDMGAGKTFIATLVGTSIDTPKLVVVPESLRLNWRKEIYNVTPDADVRVLYSKDHFDLQKDHLPDWTIVGYSTVTKYAEQLKEMGFDCIFIDEAHNCKAVNNQGKPSSKRAEVVLDLCKQAEYVYPMTGTPIPTSNKDLYNIFRMLDVENVGTVQMGQKWSFFNYGKEYCDGFNNGFGWDFTGNSKSDVLHDMLSPYMVRRLKSDVLPDLTKQRTYIPMESTSREYKSIEKRIHDMDTKKDTYMGLAMTGRRVLSKEKIAPSVDLAESILAEDKSVVIVSNFDETLDTIMKKFGDDCCCIRGGMTDTAKQQAIDDFQSGRKHVCALNIKAGGVGVTLTKAHDMIICDYDWTPANMSQVEDRICRTGQKEHCNIHYIYCENSILDTTFVQMISAKSANIDMVVDNADNTMDLSEGVDDFLKALKQRVEQEKDDKEEAFTK